MERRISYIPNNKVELIECIMLYQVEIINLDYKMGNVDKTVDAAYKNELRERLKKLNVESLQKYYKLVSKIYNEKNEEYIKFKNKIENDSYEAFLEEYLISLSPEIAELVEKYKDDNKYHLGNISIKDNPVFHHKEDGLGISPFKPGYRDISSGDKNLSYEYKTILSNYIPLVDNGERNYPRVASEYELLDFDANRLANNELIQLNMSLYSELMKRTSFRVRTIGDSINNSNIVTKYNELVLKLSRTELTKLFKKLRNIERNTRPVVTCSYDSSLSMRM